MSKYAVLRSTGTEARNLLVRRGLNVITKTVSCLSAEDLVGLMSTCFQLKVAILFYRCTLHVGFFDVYSLCGLDSVLDTKTSKV